MSVSTVCVATSPTVRSPRVKNDGSVYGVLDIDSDSKDRFLPGCEGEFEEYVRILMKRLDK